MNTVSPPKTCQGGNEKSSEQTDSVVVDQNLPEGKEDGMLQQDEEPMEEDDVKLVIDTPADNDDQRSERENKSTVLQQSNDWEFRNGTRESESVDDAKEVDESNNDGERLMPVSKDKTDVEDGVGEHSAAAEGADNCPSVHDATDTPKLPDSSPSTSTADAAGSAVTDAPDTVGTAKCESEPKPRRVYRKFEYRPTGEHILRCLVPKCSQTFDRKLTADIHNHVHPGFVPGTEGSEGPTYLQCHRCEFQAPFYHWYDLLRHMRQKHDICLVDSTAEHTCEYCGIGFETKDLLVSHIDFHYSNRYKCIHCGLLLLTWGQVRCTIHTDCFSVTCSMSVMHTHTHAGA